MKKKLDAVNLEEVRKQNLTTVMKIIHKSKVCSRSEIAEESGLQQSTITNLVNLLIEHGIVKETGLIDGKRGRRSIGLALSHDKFAVIGIRITRSAYAIGRFNIDGKYDTLIQNDFKKSVQLQDILEEICCDTQKLIDSSQIPVAAIGLAVPGPFMVKESRFMRVSYTNGWEGIRIKDWLSQRFEIPVLVEHDANAGVLAEWWFGSGNIQKGTYIYIAAGYGIGAGIIVDGTVFHGAIGTAGEFGHMSINYSGPQCSCGNYGCLELYSSTHAISQYIENELKINSKTTNAKSLRFEDILAAYHCKDALATEAINSSCYCLSLGIVNLINLFNPEGIIIGDEMAKIGSPLFETLNKNIKERVAKELYENTLIMRSSFEQDAALFGAGALAIDHVLQNPNELII